MLIERENAEGMTRVLIDTSPDLRAQLLDAGVGVIDAVVYTHAHADHVHGIDDLRMIVFNLRRRLPVWANPLTRDNLVRRFGYAFEQPVGSSYPAILEMNIIDGDVAVDGAGGRIVLSPFSVRHGRIDSLGFRIADFAYLPDVSGMTEEAWQAVSGLDCWVLDALRRDPHPSHTHLDQSLEWIARAAPRRAILTNMHIDLDHATVSAETPANVTPAHDGMTVIYDD